MEYNMRLCRQITAFKTADRAQRLTHKHSHWHTAVQEARKWFLHKISYFHLLTAVSLTQQLSNEAFSNPSIYISQHISQCTRHCENDRHIDTSAHNTSQSYFSQLKLRNWYNRHKHTRLSKMVISVQLHWGTTQSTRPGWFASFCALFMRFWSCCGPTLFVRHLHSIILLMEMKRRKAKKSAQLPGKPGIIRKVIVLIKQCQQHMVIEKTNNRVVAKKSKNHLLFL